MIIRNRVPQTEALDMDNWYQKDAGVGQVPAWDGSKFAPSKPGLKSVQVFTSSGTWSKPTGVTLVKMIVTGGGGSSGNDSSGAGGGTAIKILDVSSISNATITVGAINGDSSWSDGTNTITGGGTSTTIPSIGSGGDVNLRGGDSTGPSGSADHESVGGSSYWGNGDAYGGGATMGAGADANYNGPGQGIVYTEEY